jgi:fructosamine-3-kinase
MLEAIHSALKIALRAQGDDTPVCEVVPVSGGDINVSARVRTGRSMYFVKWNLQAPVDFFQKEADGLRRIAATKTVRVPEVVSWKTGGEDGPGFLVLEWVEAAPRRDGTGQETLGHALARLHRVTGPAFGLDMDNYIGRLPQRNGWSDDWLEFYRSRRLQPLMEAAVAKGRLSGSRRKKLERLMERLDRWLDHRHVVPSLLHGDFWSGNWLLDVHGQPVLFDPAVSYGDREMDLAFSEWFGGFHPSFYQAYEEINPVREGYEDRKPLYQLYYRMIHWLLFGEAYGGAVDQVLERYAG